ncbi:hypothetical protein tb265_30780 [Gemmatimonadetes bacterium T265]|nr:hypothetical protein tb265_30780 [Gemmatimonadetes bacterium T265]
MAVTAPPHENVPPHGTRMTLEEFFALPDEARVELVDGVLRYMDEDLDLSPGRRAHGSVAARILAALAAHVTPRGLGEVFDSSTGFLLRREPPLLLSPDVSFVEAARQPDGVPDEDGPDEVFPPDLAVEVLSPSNTASEIMGKVRDYLESGARLVWVVDPRARSVTVYHPSGPVRWLGEHDVARGEGVVPEFQMPVGAMFAGLRRRG